MNDLGFPTINVGVTKVLDDSVGSQVECIRDIDTLFANFIADVTVLPENYLFRVDAFRFLYELISRTYCLPAMNDFTLDVGEGLIISAHESKATEDSFIVRIIAMSSPVASFEMTKPQLIIFFATIIGDLVRSISATGINVFQCLRKFPPALF